MDRDELENFETTPDGKILVKPLIGLATDSLDGTMFLVAIEYYNSNEDQAAGKLSCVQIGITPEQRQIWVDMLLRLEAKPSTTASSRPN